MGLLQHTVDVSCAHGERVRAMHAQLLDAYGAWTAALTEAAETAHALALREIIATDRELSAEVAGCWEALKQHLRDARTLQAQNAAIVARAGSGEQTC